MTSKAQRKASEIEAAKLYLRIRKEVETEARKDFDFAQSTNFHLSKLMSSQVNAIRYAMEKAADAGATRAINLLRAEGKLHF